jgi:hypothetical protein
MNGKKRKGVFEKAEYRQRYAAKLRRELPRIALVATALR